jgi:hypothetical protein
MPLANDSQATFPAVSAVPHRASTLPSRRAPRLLPWAVLLCAVAVALAPAARAQTVDVTITADNAYSFGYGTVSGLSSLYGGIENCTAGAIFNCSGGPETYLGIPAPAGTFLYVVAYSDGSVTQGVLGQFASGANTVYTGNGGWEVYATGHNIDPDCFSGNNTPGLATINAEIATANANAGGANSSVGWVSSSGGSGTVGAFAVGEDNSNAGGHFPVVCNIDAGARWMWYTPDPVSVTDPFEVGPPPNLPNDANEFLIFRLPVEIVTPVTPTSWGRLKATYR